MRYFDTTSKTTFVDQDMTANQVGRKVMKTQDGGLVSMDNRDELLMVEHGFGKRSQKTTDKELVNQIPQGHYTQTQPVTIYTQNLENKNYYMSAGTGTNPFARTSGFTQPVNQTRAVKDYEGNVDFNREKTNMNFLRTTGRDLNQGNPWQQRDVQISNFEEIK